MRTHTQEPTDIPYYTFCDCINTYFTYIHWRPTSTHTYTPVCTLMIFADVPQGYIRDLSKLVAIYHHLPGRDVQKCPISEQKSQVPFTPWRAKTKWWMKQNTWGVWGGRQGATGVNEYSTYCRLLAAWCYKRRLFVLNPPINKLFGDVSTLPPSPPSMSSACAHAVCHPPLSSHH